LGSLLHYPLIIINKRSHFNLYFIFISCRDILTDRLRGSAKLPDLSLHIVDINGEDIDSVALGDTLRVQVRMSDEGIH
jgi:hypothetical protein